MTEKYMDKGSLYEFFCDEGADKFLHVNETEEFLVETVFLDYWNTISNGAPEQEGISVESYFLEGGSKLVVRITCDEDGAAEPVMMVYTPSAEHLGKHTLEISIGDNLVYWREAEHNPATEWLINGLANGITDENGNFIFTGDPVRI